MANNFAKTSGGSQIVVRKMMEGEGEDEEENSSSPLIIVSHHDGHRQQKRCINCTKSQYRFATIVLTILCLVFIFSTTILLVREKAKTTNRKRHADDLGNELYFYQVSDTHLDIYYDERVNSDNWQMCRGVKKRNKNQNFKTSDSFAYYGRVKCDTPRKLLDSAASEIVTLSSQFGKNAEFILISGDQSAHSYNYFQVDAPKSLIWSIMNSTQILSDKTRLPIIPALGNNDCPEDYKPPDSFPSSFFNSLGNKLKPYIFWDASKIAALNSQTIFDTTFNIGGYYSINVTGSLVIILLNTNYWNTKAYSLNPNITFIGDLQMEWFKEQLHSANANGKKVIICGHIPPGYSTYKDEASFWLENYNKEYVAEVYKYIDTVTGQLFGHVHQDKIKVQQAVDEFKPSKSTQPAKSFALICPSITPIYGSNPAFRLFTMSDDDSSLIDYSQYFMDFTLANVYKYPIWKLEYTFSTLYSKLDTQSIHNIVENLISVQESSWYTYSSHMKTLYGGITTYTRYDEYCSSRHVSKKAFHDCLSYYKQRGL